MKIAFFDNLPDGGAKRFLYEEIKGLSGDHEIHYFTQTVSRQFKPKPYCKKMYLYQNPKILGFRPVDDLVKLVFSFLSQRQMAKTINRLGCDLCVVHADKNLEAPFLLRYLKVKSLYYSQEPYRLIYDQGNQIPDHWPLVNKVYERLYRNLLKYFERKNLLSAGVVLTNSYFTKRQLTKIYGVSAKVVYPGVDTSVFKPPKLPKKAYAIFIGSDNLLDGWDRMKKLEAYFEKKGIEIKKLYFQKPLTDQQLAVEYGGAICLLALDRREPFGLKVIEALACGTDVIAVSDGGYPEIAQLYHQYGLKYFSWRRHCENILNCC